MLYRIIKVILWPIFKLTYRFSVDGAAHLPKTGPVLLVSNHASYLDPVILGLASSRRVSFMAKEELFEIFGLGRLIRALDSFPIKRGAFDREALRTALKKLAAGEVVGIFPQGSRQRDGVSNGMPGTALIAFKSAAPIVPAAIFGTDKVMLEGKRWPRWPRIKVRFGEPITLNQAGEKKEVVAEATERIVNEIKALLEM